MDPIPTTDDVKDDETAESHRRRKRIESDRERQSYILTNYSTLQPNTRWTDSTLNAVLSKIAAIRIPLRPPSQSPHSAESNPSSTAPSHFGAVPNGDIDLQIVSEHESSPTPLTPQNRTATSVPSASTSTPIPAAGHILENRTISLIEPKNTLQSMLHQAYTETVIHEPEDSVSRSSLHGAAPVIPSALRPGGDQRLCYERTLETMGIAPSNNNGLIVGTKEDAKVKKRTTRGSPKDQIKKSIKYSYQVCGATIYSIYRQSEA